MATTTNNTQLTPEQIEQAIQARRAYQRAYKAAHRDKVREAARKYYHAHPEKQKIYSLRYWARKAEAEAEGGAERGGD